jgi:hypothetical protein
MIAGVSLILSCMRSAQCPVPSAHYRWLNGPDMMGWHGLSLKKHDTSTTQARVHSASASMGIV